MGGVKGRSGPPGNLNATVRSWRVFWQRRVLRPKDRWVSSLLEQYEADLVSDRGGPDNMTAGEKRMLELAGTARGCVLLILAEARERGFIHVSENGKAWGLQPGIEALPRFLTVEQRALATLGLKRQERRLPSLHEVLRAQQAIGTRATTEGEAS